MDEFSNIAKFKETRIELTDEVINILVSEREKANLTARLLSKRLRKSPSFINSIESKKVKTIKPYIFFIILREIHKSKKPQDFLQYLKDKNYTHYFFDEDIDVSKSNTFAINNEKDVNDDNSELNDLDDYFVQKNIRSIYGTLQRIERHNMKNSKKIINNINSLIHDNFGLNLLGNIPFSLLVNDLNEEQKKILFTNIAKSITTSLYSFKENEDEIKEGDE